jgi:hypothetical protein
MENPPRFESEVPRRDTRQKRWLARWADTRRRGRVSFVLRRGILIQGVIFAIWMTGARLLGLFGDRGPVRISFLLLSFALYAVFFGVWMGLWTWHVYEKRFKDISDASQSA